MIRRVFIEKKLAFSREAHELCHDLKENLAITGLNNVRMLTRYDVEGLSEPEFEQATQRVFSEPQVDTVCFETVEFASSDRIFAVEFLPGQFDQCADSAAQCVQILTQKQRPTISVARIIVLEGSIDDAAFAEIKKYCINTVDSREASLDKPETLQPQIMEPADVAVLTDFITHSAEQLEHVRADLGLAMSQADIEFCQAYFRDTENRDPSITEIKMLDTYWSDHCRHTTFLTEITDVSFDDHASLEPVRDAFTNYQKSREYVYGDKLATRDITLMDIAVLGMKELRKAGKLDTLEVSEEINACSIIVPVDIDGQTEEWLVMFKNETHNHPTEIEPFGGAATCLGGAIRDPLSGRSYVYQAMRVTGAADPRKPIAETIPGKLPQRKICLEAARGYSSYGNQIGLATGQVAEVYHPGYEAKRMEIGAVIAAAPRKNVFRGEPQPGNVIILVGGRTGRDGIGGATGSSKEHTDTALENSAEVQKGDPPMERKIQRLFRQPEVAQMIIRCNDFGAGGVSVAIGELAPSLNINLDQVTKKYAGLDGTEIAISESQERMAVVLETKNVDAFIQYVTQENLEARVVADVTDNGRLRMDWRGKRIVDLSREFLDSNGVKQQAKVHVSQIESDCPLTTSDYSDESIETCWKTILSDLNRCSQKGLIERFDSTIGAATLNHPFGGKMRLTQPEAMSAKIPLLKGETETATLMSYGFNPYISEWSPFHGAVYAVLESVAKIVASGGDAKAIQLTLQEYFERLRGEPARWGKPFAALLGAHWMQTQLEIAAIGGKDSMSGSFKDMDVPPTLVSFAVTTTNIKNIVSPEFKNTGSRVAIVSLEKDANQLPLIENLKSNYAQIHQAIAAGHIISAQTIRSGGIAEAISKMALGNWIGFQFENTLDAKTLFQPDYGSIIIELSPDAPDMGQLLGTTQAEAEIVCGTTCLSLENIRETWEAPLETIYPTQAENPEPLPAEIPAIQSSATLQRTSPKIAQPRVFLPVFPGTNCEYDTARQFEAAGAVVDTVVFNNLDSNSVEASLIEFEKHINNAQIIMLPGGFSAGDQPDGSGKFIAAVFRNPRVCAATMQLLQERDGLMLGICNGFQALIKLGLVPHGEIRDLDDTDPTLTFNDLGRHVSCYVQTKVTSKLSPWLNNTELGAVHTLPVSHGEGKFYATEAMLKQLASQGQIATQYVDVTGKATMDIANNPNGSLLAVEGITSPDGRIFGKMAHSERIGQGVGKNIQGNLDQALFASGVQYFL